MPELLDRLKPAISAAAIAGKLASAERELADAQSEHGEAALASVADTPGAGQRLTALTTQLSDLRSRIVTLKAAHATASAKEEKAAAASRAAIQRVQIRAVEQHLAARDRASEELSAALTQVAASWRVLLDRSAKAVAATPIGAAWPLGSLCERDTLKRLVERELFRLAGDATLGNTQSFPGANPHDMRLLSQPEAIPELASELKKASRYTIDTLTGQVQD
jgi:hypothetical protein